MSSTRLLFVHARSPLHAGTGQATAAVDLPIARDRATHYPLLPGSSIKGTLRAAAREGASGFDKKLHPRQIAAFGPETADASDSAGQLAFTDARLLLLPVRSVAGTFAWVTSPYLLACFARDAALAGVTQLPKLPEVPANGAQVAPGSLLIVKDGTKDKVVLEEFDLEAGATLGAWADKLAPLVFPGDETWQALLKKRLCVVHDDTMTFLAQHGTEITTRVSINPETGTAKKGQLWTEEHLPAESVLVGVIENLKPDAAHFDLISDHIARPVQLGGKATVGRGRCQLHLSAAPSATKGA
jgi:CRISPR-associated protein Cmr4